MATAVRTAPTRCNDRSPIHVPAAAVAVDGPLMIFLPRYNDDDADAVVDGDSDAALLLAPHTQLANPIRTRLAGRASLLLDGAGVDSVSATLRTTPTVVVVDDNDDIPEPNC